MAERNSGVSEEKLAASEEEKRNMAAAAENITKRVAYGASKRGEK